MPESYPLAPEATPIAEISDGESEAGRGIGFMTAVIAHDRGEPLSSYESLLLDFRARESMAGDERRRLSRLVGTRRGVELLENAARVATFLRTVVRRCELDFERRRNEVELSSYRLLRGLSPSLFGIDQDWHAIWCGLNDNSENFDGVRLLAVMCYLRHLDLRCECLRGDLRR